MARFEITAPDGKTYEINAPDGTTGDQAMSYLQQQMGKETATDPQPSGPGRFSPQSTPGLSIPEANPAVDLAKSVGVGLARGAIGMAGLPGTIEQLGRMGINYGAQALGKEGNAVSPETALPTGADLQKRVEGYTGKFYKPKTTAGEYARTLGEFAPGALFPGGVAQKVLGNVVGPALASETAGQLTKGTELEPWARVGGALVGGGIGNIPSRAYTPVPTDPTRARMVQTLRNEGVDALTAGEVTGSKPLRYLEQHASDIPLSGGRARAQADRAAEQFTQATLRRAGVNAPRATQDVIDAAFTTQGQTFDNLANNATLVLNRTDRRRMANAIQGYAGITPPSQRAPILQAFFDDVDRLIGQQASGQLYQRYRSMFEQSARQVQQRDPVLADAFRGLRNVLDDAVERSLPANMRGQWQQARREYRNLLVVERASSASGENAALGLISPAQLANATKAIHGTRNFARGRGDYAELARAGQAVMSPLPNSGTPARLAAQSIGAGVGGLVGGTPGALLAPIGSALAARAFTSAPVQRYLGANARMAPTQINARQGGLLSSPAAIAASSRDDERKK